MQTVVDRKELARLARGSTVPVPEAVLEPLAIYLEMLCRWNTVMNLVGTRSWKDTWNRLLLDSFHLALFMDELPLPVSPLCWDLGAGAGLPGIPLRMVFTRGNYVLVEVREKRAIFLSTALQHLHLPNTQVFRGRVEDFFRRQQCLADCILSRAFMPWRDILTLVRPYLQSQGLLIIMACEAAPASLPPGWFLAGMHEYTAERDARWLWALSPAPLQDDQDGLGSSEKV